MFTAILAATAVAASASAPLSPPAGGVQPREQAAYDAQIAKEARAAADLFSGSPCKDATVTVLRITPVKIAEKPDLIAWREKVKVEGCGAASVQNLNVGRVGGASPWKISHGLPGDSLAEINLQETTLPDAIIQARDGLPNSCTTVKIGDLYVAALPGNVDLLQPGAPEPDQVAGHATLTLPEEILPDVDKLDLSAAWMEVWPLKPCDLDRIMGVVFVPTKDHARSAYLFIPIWQQVHDKGSDALPTPVALDQ